MISTLFRLRTFLSIHFLCFALGVSVSMSVAWVGTASAQATDGLQVKAAALAESREAMGTYVINPLDRLMIVVYAGERQLQELDEVVRSDGTVYLSFLEKDVTLGGMRIIEAENEIEKLARAFIKEPRIIITVSNSFAQTVSTYGKIRNIDVEIRAPLRILQLIAQAGGPLDEAKADSMRVISADGTVRFFNYERVNRNPNNVENFYLKPGDIVFVPGIEDFTVSVMGDVSRPGNFPMKKGDKLLDALVKAGSWGVNAELKNIRLLRVRVGRRVEVKKINLKEIFNEGDISLNYVLDDGDIIFVPSQKTQTYLSMIYTSVTLLSSLASMIYLLSR